MANQRSVIDIDRQIDRVQARMKNMAKRSTKRSAEIMRKYAYKVMDRARWYAPEETGALGKKENWIVEESSNGINGRLTFNVRLKKNARRYVRNRSVAVSRYAGIMHDGKYRIRGLDEGNNPINSRLKARRNAFIDGTRPEGQPRLSTSLAGSTRIGTLYLTRAANQYRLITHEKILEAMAKELK